MCLLLAKLSTGYSVSPSGDTCLQFCEALSSDCYLPTFCGPTGDCIDLFWSDYQRQSLDMTYATSLEDTDGLQVTCLEAEEGLLALRSGDALPRKTARHEPKYNDSADGFVMGSIYQLERHSPVFFWPTYLPGSGGPQLAGVGATTAVPRVSNIVAVMTTVHPPAPPPTPVPFMKLKAAAAAFNGAIFPALVDAIDSYPFLTGKWVATLSAARVKGNRFLKLLSQAPIDDATRLLTLDVLRKHDWDQAIDVLAAATINMRFLPSPELQRFAREVITQFQNIMNILDETGMLGNTQVILSTKALDTARDAPSDIFFRLGESQDDDDSFLPPQPPVAASEIEMELTRLLASLAAFPNITTEDEVLNVVMRAVLHLTQAELAWVGSRVCGRFDAVAMPALMRSHTTNAALTVESTGYLVQFLTRGCGPRRVSHRTRLEYIPNLLFFSCEDPPHQEVAFRLRYPLRSMELMEQTLRIMKPMY